MTTIHFDEETIQQAPIAEIINAYLPIQDRAMSIAREYTGEYPDYVDFEECDLEDPEHATYSAWGTDSDGYGWNVDISYRLLFMDREQRKTEIKAEKERRAADDKARRERERRRRDEQKLTYHRAAIKQLEARLGGEE